MDEKAGSARDAVVDAAVVKRDEKGRFLGDKPRTTEPKYNFRGYAARCREALERADGEEYLARLVVGLEPKASHRDRLEAYRLLAERGHGKPVGMELLITDPGAVAGLLGGEVDDGEVVNALRQLTGAKGALAAKSVAVDAEVVANPMEVLANPAPDVLSSNQSEGPPAAPMYGGSDDPDPAAGD